MSDGQRPCPICGNAQAQKTDISETWCRYDCPVCTSFDIADDAVEGLPGSSLQKQLGLVPAFIREKTIRGQKVKLVLWKKECAGNARPGVFAIEQAVEEMGRLTFPEKLDKALLGLAKHSKRPGAPVELPDSAYPVLYAENVENMHFMWDALAENGWVTPRVGSSAYDPESGTGSGLKAGESLSPGYVQLMPTGWSRVAEIEKENACKPAEEMGEKTTFGQRLLQSTENEQNTQPKLASPYVDETRIAELVAVHSADYDLSRLLRLCEELNRCFANECYLAVAMLVRAICDHVPPIFGCKSFAEVANNYGGGGKSFKASMEHLENSFRNIANEHLHRQIRKKESLPNKTQVNFCNDLDVLLGEVARVLK